MSETLTIQCPQCGKQTRVGPSAIGKRGRCGKCSHSFLIESPATVANEIADAGDGLVPLEASYDLVPLDVPQQPAPRPAVAPLPTPAKAASPATPPGRSPQIKRAIDDGRRPGGSSAWIMGLALGGAGLVVCTLILAALAWAFMRPKGPAAVAGNGAAAQGAPVAEAGGAAGSTEDDITREPKAGSQFWIPAHPLASADLATWKVTAEDAAVASGLHSVFVLDDEFPPIHLLSASESAQAATVRAVEDPSQPGSGLIRLVWMRHDLRTGQTLAKLPLSLIQSGSEWKNLAALSPSGKQLAVALSYLPSQLEVWSDDGSKVTTIALDGVTDEARPRRVRFVSESRVIVDVAGNIVAYDLPAGTAAFKIQAGFAAGPVLSLGRKWLAGYTGDGIAWFSTADGSPAGKIEFDDSWDLHVEPGWRERLDWGLAFHPSGKSVAVLARGKSNYQTLVAHYDLATGRALEQFVLPALNYELMQSAYWCGERQLHLVTGHVVDLDLKTWLGCHGDRAQLGLQFSTQPPDQRCWRLLWNGRGEALDPRLGLPGEVHSALVATTVPDAEIKRRRAEAQDSLIWGPEFAVALDTDGILKEDRRPLVLGAVADLLAERGFRVDPAARFRLMVKGARALSVPNIMKPGVYSYIGGCDLELVDSHGQTVSRHGNFGVTGDGDYDDCWKALVEIIRKDIDSRGPLRMVWREPDGRLADPHEQRFLAIEASSPRRIEDGSTLARNEARIVSP